MYLWLKRWFYGCEHEYQFLTKFDTMDSRGKYIIYMTSVHRCTKCMELKKDVIKS